VSVPVYLILDLLIQAFIAQAAVEAFNQAVLLRLAGVDVVPFDAVLVGPEMRGSSPVRIDRDRDSFQIPGMLGVYPVGEGAGYAGGIMSAGVDGIEVAEALGRDLLGVA
jgi:uncharacterized FAD-dependent dehydrogenase